MEVATRAAWGRAEWAGARRRQVVDVLEMTAAYATSFFLNLSIKRSQARTVIAIMVRVGF